MTDWELQWQERVLKVVGAVAKHLIVNDEAEIAEVVRRRLFEDLGPEATRKRVARAYADWCFERRPAAAGVDGGGYRHHGGQGA
jgi:predicted AAA+ superfamily ATPase